MRVQGPNQLKLKCGAKAMNKKIIWVFVFLILIAKVSAIGIGAPNVALAPVGRQTIDLYVVNDEHKDLTATISVSGELKDKITVYPDTLELSSSEELKKFSITIDFPEKINGETRVTVSEVAEITGQIKAVAYASYKLRIVNDDGKDKKNNVQSGISPVLQENASAEQTLEKEQTLESVPGQPEKKQIEKLSTASEMAGIREIIYKPVPLTLILVAVIALVASFDVLFLSLHKKQKIKNPLREFIEGEREIGVDEPGIKKKLIDAGWHEEDIESAFKKMK